MIGKVWKKRTTSPPHHLFTHLRATAFTFKPSELVCMAGGSSKSKRKVAREGDEPDDEAEPTPKAAKPKGRSARSKEPVDDGGDDDQGAYG